MSHITSCNRWQAISCDPQKGVFTCCSADGVVELSWAVTLEAEGKTLSSTNAAFTEGDLVNLLPDGEGTVTFHFTEPALSWQVTLALADDGTSLVLSSHISNTGEAPVRLGRCALVDASDAAGRVMLDGDDGNAVYLHLTATTGPNQVFRADSDEPGFSRVLLHIVSHGARRALHLGFITFDRLTTFGEFSYDPANGVTGLQAVCDFEGWQLNPGADVASETLLVEACEDYHASLHNWADRVADYYKPAIWPKIPGGWLGWAWVDAFNVETYEDVVLRNVRAIRRRLAGHDIEYVWVSIGNIKDGLPGNWLQWDYNSFPGGHEHLVSELAALDFKLGLWCGAFWLCSALEDQVEQMHDALLHYRGEPTVARPEWQYGASGRLPREQRPCIYALDPTHPKTRDFLTDAFQEYRRWGIRYFMVDFIHAISGNIPGDVPYDEYHDTSIHRSAGLLREGLRIVREAAGPDTYLLSSSGPTMPNVGLMDACRVGNDYGEGRALNPESYFFPATFVINSANFWTSHRRASENMAAVYFTHRKLYINDSGNVMTVDKPIPLCEAHIVATIFGLGGGPVMLGDDIDRICEERLALIRKVFPRTPECARPVDLFDAPHPDYPRIFHHPVQTAWGKWDVVGIINYSDDPLVLPVELERLGLDPEGDYRLWEFWNEQYLGVIHGELRATVPPRSAALYRIEAVKPHPWLLSTDIHVLQGRTEVADLHWDEASMTLSGTVSRPAGETGGLYLCAPPGLYVVNPRGWHIARDAADETMIVYRNFEFTTEPSEWSIRFAPIEKIVDMYELDLT